jgi:flagellar basal-body rod protein FlgB
MSVGVSGAFGIHTAALALRGQRAEILAANLANADTPGYLARDMDFRAALEQAQGQPTLAVTQPAHFPTGPGGGVAALYRVPLQPSVDGNTVDPQVEKTQFLQNAMHYQASLTFLNSRITSLIRALRGE